jgi:hypothetical protein
LGRFIRIPKCPVESLYYFVYPKCPNEWVPTFYTDVPLNLSSWVSLFFCQRVYFHCLYFSTKWSTFIVSIFLLNGLILLSIFLREFPPICLPKCPSIDKLTLLPNWTVESLFSYTNVPLSLSLSVYPNVLLTLLFVSPKCP